MDLTVLATDRGSVPMNIGAILRFDTTNGPSLFTVRALLSERVPTIPRRPPTRSELTVDAASEKFRVVSTLTARLRLGLAGLRELGLGPTRPRMIEKTSLNRPTSHRRRLATVAVPLADIVRVAHRAGG